MKEVVDPHINDDSSYYSLQTKPKPNMEYETLPDCTETPSPTPTPPIDQARLRPLPPSHLPHPPSAPPPPIIEVKSVIEVPSRVEHTPLPETPIPDETHLDEVVKITILGLKSPETERMRSEWRKHREGKDAVKMTLREWAWYNKVKGRHAIAGDPTEDWNYDIVATKKGTEITVDLEEVCEEDRDMVEAYSGTQMSGFPGPGGEREKVQIVVRKREGNENRAVNSRYGGAIEG